jgi:DNA-binding LacI/PurR family transcriptional regulator
LKSLIEEGVYKPGERLPGAVKLSKQYKVSPVTANKILGNLESAGLVVRSSRKGTFVKKPSTELRRILVPVSNQWYTKSPQLFSYLNGIIQESGERNIELKLLPYDSEIFQSPDKISQLNCQGIIQLGEADAMFPYNALKQSGLPWLVVGVSEKVEQSVVSDDRKMACCDLVKAMHKNGCEKIGFIGNLAHPNHRACRDGYLLADTGAGSILVRDADENNLEGAIRELLEMMKIDGLVICGSMLLKGVNILRRLESTIPLGGFEEISAFSALEGEIYLAKMNYHETGKMAVSALADGVRRNRKPEDILVKVELIKPDFS